MKNSIVTAVTYKNGAYSRAEVNHYRIGNGKDGKISWEYFEGNFTKIPDFTRLKVLKSGKSKELSLTHIPHRPDHFAIRFKCTLDLPVSSTSKSNPIELQKGLHSIEVWYFEDNAGEELEIYIEGPNISKQIITDEFIQ